MLPKSLYYASNKYLAPWFYQNLTAFAPEPPFNRHVFVYRYKDNKGWSDWDYPAYPYLQAQWLNRFDPALKTHDQLELVGDNLYWAAKSIPGKNIYVTDRGKNLPAVKSCMSVIKMIRNDSSLIDSFQLGVYIERLRVNDLGVLSRIDSALFYPKYPWYE